jgi:hypothetical protein
MTEMIIPLVEQVLEDPLLIENLVIIIIMGTFPFFHVLVSLSNPLLLLSGICIYLMFPTLAVTFPMYSFLRLDDFTWGTRA